MASRNAFQLQDLNFDLPIEQLVRHLDTRFQLGFANEAKRHIVASEEFALCPSRRGLHVLARNEDALGAPIGALRKAYGPSLAAEAPEVRYLRGAQLQEPVMHVRISLELAHREAVKRALHARGAVPEEEYARDAYAVLRYEAPLARLIGLPAEIARLAGGRARYWIVLSHYAPVDGGPGGRAA